MSARVIRKLSLEAIDYLTQTALNQKATLDYQPNYETDAWNRTNECSVCQKKTPRGFLTMNPGAGLPTTELSG
ncbi:MAG: hypothetical protein UV54_C0047G0003 [Candidatus Beckwithbacteria bacterium GW2011_GWA2_43_10]|uniref:Uncharacterized protein n=1 Tax=Candidatus Beckwithbacteria bacterium GW2011_GWA2_43_10 TaxID=1618369 RepID=A0A0G1C008_9BACT|nr:MAG: hypothetical protein UV54_C0047G0003 [Candidatus Beckwithbacteria bacterium GW2011_GWA2_43_10]